MVSEEDITKSFVLATLDVTALAILERGKVIYLLFIQSSLELYVI